MRRLLLDSHVMLWWLSGERLTREASVAIADPESSVLLSIASVWELAIKAGLRRLRVPDRYVDVLTEQGVDLLGITLAHTYEVQALPPLHRDPFDRMLVAQARSERLVLVTRDEQLAAYDVTTLMA